MAEFSVHYFNAQGSAAQMTVRAADEQAAASASGIAPQWIVSVEGVSGNSNQALTKAKLMSSGGATQFPLRLFSQELAVLLNAGIPLLESLQTLSEKESSAAVARTLEAVVAQLQSGQPFSAALAAQPQAFDALFVAVIQSSERTGQTAVALAEHAAYLGWVDALRNKLVAASIYPLTLIVAGMAVIVFLLLFVVPRFAGILEGVGGTNELPFASEVLIQLGGVGGQHPWLIVASALALLLTPVLAWRQGALRSRLLTSLWRLPLLGPKLHLLALAQFYRTSAMLLGAGVPAVSAMGTARQVISTQLQAALDEATVGVARGERLSDALQRAGLTTPVSLRMIRVGERSGNLAVMLRQAAEFYDEELTRLTELVTRLVNPVLMLVMGVLIGGIVVLMYLPIFQLVEQVQ
jgi:general secretion pathway protein F